VQFGRLSVQFEMTETHVVASQGGAAGADGADGADGGLEDSLASLGKLLDGATADVPGGQQIGLDDLIARLGDQVDRLRELLGKIGGALRARAHGGPDAGGGSGQCGAAAMAVDVHIRALSLTQVSAVDGGGAS
jgi:hypothetical protein